jgi:pyruvate dehydrogenase E2 component (dihydrolipoamide acetyltransferase)
MKLRVTVNGVAYDVDVEILEEKAGTAVPPAPPAPAPAPRPAAPVAPVAPAPAAPAPAPAAGGKTLTSPIPGTVLEILAKPGQAVKNGEAVIIVDAMKMNTQISANQDGVVKEILVAPGEAVKMGQALLTFE